jgi:hypothetical protein
MKEVKDMTREELLAELENLRSTRKKGYTQNPKVRRSKNANNEFSGISADLAEKLLAELLKGD